jgi:hypothetical protein
VKIVLDSVPDDANQSVTFNTGGGLNGAQDPSSFELTDPTPFVLQPSKTFQVAAGSGYSISEVVPSGWNQVSATCSDGSPVSNISLSSEENVTCTFTNQRQAKLTVTQDTQPDDSQDFNFSVNGGLNPSTFALDDDGNDGNGTSSSRTFSDIAPGTYSVTQALPSGWSRFFGYCSDGSVPSSVAISIGERVICNFGNTPVGSPAPASGTGAGGQVARNVPANAYEASSPSISDDGRYVAFESFATNLVPGVSDSSGDIYVRDLRTGDVKLVSRATGATGAKGDLNSFYPSISGDGRYVAWLSYSTNLSPDDTNEDLDVYVRDLVANTTTLASRATGLTGAKANAETEFNPPAISADGRSVAFATRATNLSVDDSDALVDVYVRNLQANTTTLVSRASGATGSKGNGNSTDPSISADGRYAAFASAATNLSPDDADSGSDVFVRDLQANTTTLASRATGAAGVNGFGSDPFISGDGQRVAFIGANLETDSSFGAFVRDLQAQTTVRASRATGPAGAAANGGASDPAISADGRFVTFDTRSTNLDPADALTQNNSVYMRDLVTNETSLISRTTGALGGPADYTDTGNVPAISEVANGGRFVAFESLGSNLAPDVVVNGWGGQVYVRDTETKVTSLESRSSPTYARPKAATPIYASLVPAYDTCGSPNRAHAAPLSFSSCSPPAQSSSRLTFGTPDANSQPAKGVASLKTIVSPGNAATPADEANVQFTTSIADVRNTTGLSDYTGEVEVRIPIQVTDRINYPPEGGQGPGTSTQFDFSLAVPCSATADASVGSSCDLVTTADALTPGTVTESARAIWAWGQVEVYDGGPDSDADTKSGNSLFLRQGVFVP